MTNYEEVAAAAISNSAVWSGDRLNVTKCSRAVVQSLLHIVIEDARRLLIEELVENLEDQNFGEPFGSYNPHDEIKAWLQSYADHE